MLVLDYGIDFPLAPFEALIKGDWETLGRSVLNTSNVLYTLSIAARFIKKVLPPVPGLVLDSVLAGSTLLLGLNALRKQLPYLQQLNSQGQLQFHHVLMALGGFVPLVTMGMSLPSLFQASPEAGLSFPNALDAVAGVLPLTNRTMAVFGVRFGVHVNTVIVNQTLLG